MGKNFTIGQGRIWPKKHLMDRPWEGGVSIYIYIYIFFFEIRYTYVFESLKIEQLTVLPGVREYYGWIFEEISKQKETKGIGISMVIEDVNII